MARELSPTVKRPRISLDVDPQLRRRLRLAAAQKDQSARQYILQALEERLAEDLRPQNETPELLALTALADPVLAELWDNERDASYDQL